MLDEAGLVVRREAGGAVRGVGALQRVVAKTTGQANEYFFALLIISLRATLLRKIGQDVLE